MSTNRSKKDQLIRSLPSPFAQYTPRWLPYRLLCVWQFVVGVLSTTFVLSVLFWNHHFRNIDIWGVRRDRAKEREMSKNWKKHRKEEAYWKPTALNVSGKTPLDLLLDWCKWWTWKKTSPRKALNQRQSPLGRLPEEVRQLIYAHLVAGTRFHIQESYKRCGYVECVCNHARPCDQVLECLGPHLDKTPRFGEPSYPSTVNRLILSSYDHLKLKPTSVVGNNTYTPHIELLGLAKTCKLLSRGYLDALYAAPTLSFTSLRQFYTFSTTISAHRLNRITSLEFHCELQSFSTRRMDTGWEEIAQSQWRKAWEAVADMGSLRSIHADVRMGHLYRVREHSAGGVHKWMEDRIFDPMRRVRQARVFDVVVNWNQSQHFVLGVAPFTLERRVHRLAWSDHRMYI